MEVEERAHRTVGRRIQDARLPRMKTLEEFDFSPSQVPATRIRGLAAGGGYLERAEPIVLIGECGTGKTHLATGLCVARCRQKKRVRFPDGRRPDQRPGRSATRQPVSAGSGSGIPVRSDRHPRSLDGQARSWRLW